MKNPIPYLVLALSLLPSALPAHAVEGTHTGGGGDASEARIDEIRADILKWISAGGPSGLNLPQGQTLGDYEAAMSAILAPHTVVVGFVTTAQESVAADPEQKVRVEGQAKTCRGFKSSYDGRPHILCNQERFAATAEAEQYRLVHHEFAGLAGVEHNLGAASDYVVSNQMTEYLVPQTVLKLAVKKPSVRKYPVKCNGKCEPTDFLGEYDLVGSGVGSHCRKNQSISTSEDGENLLFGELKFGMFGPHFDTSGNMDIGIDTHWVWNRIETRPNYLALISKTKHVGDSPLLALPYLLLGEVKWYRTELMPTLDGRLQIVTLSQSEVTNNYYTASNCLYERRSQ